MIKVSDKHRWDFIIEQQSYFGDLAKSLDVNKDYLIYQTDFLKAVGKQNKFLAIKSVNMAIKRLEELKNA